MNTEIKIEYNELSEYKRVVFTCLQIVRGFYQSKRFFLSHELLKFENRQVYIPNFDFINKEDFWKNIEILSREQYIDDVTSIATKFKNSGVIIQSLNSVELDKYKEKISKYLDEPIKVLRNIFPQISNKKVEINIIPTLYGTTGSFERAIINDDKVIITVTSRVDVDNSFLLEIILSSLVFAIKYERNRKVVKWQQDWEINESLVDFFLQHTLLNKYSQNYIGTMEINEKPEIHYLELIENSKNIFSKLGYPIKSTVVIENDTILINGEIPKKPFSETESRVVKKLVEKKGELITNEQIQDVLWEQNYDKYSLWALAKTMQRIRDKIKANGISSEIIQTVRGCGYLIYD